MFVVRNQDRSLCGYVLTRRAPELLIILYCLTSSVACFVDNFSRAAAAKGEDQVQCRAAFEGVLFGGLVVSPVGEEVG
jgi:hypothetical protein